LLFACSPKQFEAVQTKGEAPAPQQDKGVLKLVQKVVQARLAQYATTLQVRSF
jgi:hypothetical protein